MMKQLIAFAALVTAFAVTFGLLFYEPTIVANVAFLSVMGCAVFGFWAIAGDIVGQ